MTWLMAPKRLGSLLRSLRSKKRFGRLDRKDHVAAQVRKAVRQAQMGQFAEAEDNLTKAADDYPDHPGPLRGLASLARLQEDWPKALKCSRLLAERHPDLMHGWILTGKALIKLRYFTEAERVLAVAVAKWPNDAAPMEALARVAQRRRNWPEALKRWRLVVKHHPRLPRARIQVAQILVKLNQPKDAQAELAETFARRPNHIGVRVAMTDVLLRLGQIAEAERLLAGTHTETLDDPVLMDAWACVFEYQQRWSEALKYWKALTFQHGDRSGIRVQSHIALCLFKTGRTDDARSVVAEMVGSEEEGQARNELFGLYAPNISYYGRQIEDSFRNMA